jgi:hypothetical protein
MTCTEMLWKDRWLWWGAAVVVVFVLVAYAF